MSAVTITDTWQLHVRAHNAALGSGGRIRHVRQNEGTESGLRTVNCHAMSRCKNNIEFCDWFYGSVDNLLLLWSIAALCAQALGHGHLFHFVIDPLMAAERIADLVG